MQYATAKIGAILVNSTRPTAPTSWPTCSTSRGSRLLVAAPSFKTSDYGAMIEEVRPDCPALRPGRLPRQRRLGRAARPRASDVAGRARATGRRRSTPDDPINIQYTSGTTGFPKGATLSHHNILNNGYFVGELCGFTETDRVCIPVPFYHCFGMVMGNLGATTHGASMVIPAPGFDPEATLEAVAEERCTSLYGVPTMFIAELAEPDFADLRPVSSLRTGIMAGSPCPVEVMKQVIERMDMAEVTIVLRHDRDLAGVDPDPRRTTPSTAGWPPSAGCTRTSRSRSSTRTPA